jgi:hypothetical protein
VRLQEGCFVIMQRQQCRYIGQIYSLFQKGDSRHKIVLNDLTWKDFSSVTNIGVHVFVAVCRLCIGTFETRILTTPLQATTDGDMNLFCHVVPSAGNLFTLAYAKEVIYNLGRGAAFEDSNAIGTGQLFQFKPEPYKQ